MADYNIQMKQFNGNNYDNLYPASLASLVGFIPSGSLMGSNIQDVVTELNDSRPYIISGSYVGNGVFGSTHPNTLVFDKDIVYVTIVDSSSTASSNFDQSTRLIFLGQSKDGHRTYSYINKTLSWFGSDASNQLNASGHTYFYVAIASQSYVPYVGQSWVITESTTFIVPITGNYKLELHGGGGGGGGAFTTSVYSGYVGGGGGGSGQLYNNIPLTKDESIQVTIGVGGDGGASGGSRPSGDVPAEAGQQGGTTTFGTYSIEGGLGGNPATNSHHGVGGAASGNIATNGADGHRDIYPTGGSGGSRYGSYGNGGAGLFGSTPAEINKGRDGVIILTYLGG